MGTFYCPPNSRKKEKLTTHIITNAHVLLSKYPNSGMYLGEDKNSLNLAPILQGLPRCRQIVTKNTHDNKCLDVLITNLHTLYQVPIIYPPLQPDCPTRAKPSDHLVPVAYPITGGTGAVTRQYQVKTVRPLPDSGMREIGEWLARKEWEEMGATEDPNKILEIFEEHINTKIHSIFPEKSFKVSNQDLPFINWKLMKLKRKVQRLYRTKGRKQDYLKLLR